MLNRNYKKITDRVHKEGSQSNRILKHMQEGYGITPITALQNYGCFRLAAVVFDLKRELGKNVSLQNSIRR